MVAAGLTFDGRLAYRPWKRRLGNNKLAHVADIYKANAEDRKDILDTIARFCDTTELTFTIFFNLTTRGKSNGLAEISVPDPKKDRYRGNTPLIMEQEQARNKNVHSNLTPSNYIIRKVDTNLTQIVHGQRLEKYILPYQPVDIIVNKGTKFEAENEF